jgi:hypothetical protein
MQYPTAFSLFSKPYLRDVASGRFFPPSCLRYEKFIHFRSWKINRGALALARYSDERI